MRRVAVLLAGLVGLPAANASAGPTAGGLASANVEYLSTVTLQGRNNGGRLVGKHFYVTTGKDLTIFDVSDPVAPRQVGHLDFDPVDAYYYTGYQEDPDTNGKVLIRHGDAPFDPGFMVVDVHDPTKPAIVGTANVGSQHTVSCVLDCTWAYGSEGQIVDVRDPTKPKQAGNWREGAGAKAKVTSTHDVTEVAPGLVLTATEPIMLLDARTNPANPTLLATAKAPGFVHGVLWPTGGQDDFALGGGEASGPACGENRDASFYTYDTRGWQTSRLFKLIAEFRLTEGDPQNGRTMSTDWCTHWFESHPRFGGGGLVAIAWYQQGTRFLKVALDGKIEEVGWFLPWGGATWSAHWITDRIVYAADHQRGIDILRWTGDIPKGRSPAGAAPPPPSAGAPEPSAGAGGGPTPARAISFDDLVRLPSSRRCVTARTLRVRVRRRRADPVTTLTLRVGRGRANRVSGRRLTRPLRLRKLPRKRFTLTVEVRTRSGHHTAARRTYIPCRRR